MLRLPPTVRGPLPLAESTTTPPMERVNVALRPLPLALAFALILVPETVAEVIFGGVNGPKAEVVRAPDALQRFASLHTWRVKVRESPLGRPVTV